ncbi:hydrolase, TatD family [gamma proteobacterium HTCC5015]|nr:hydrolase, TatD family [gamma proteobacterium HTCC5015]
MSKKKRPPIPHYDMPIIETHCHLDYLKEQSFEETLQQASAVGVERFVTIAVDPGNLATVRAMTERDARVYGTQGIHPHEADHYNDEVEREIRQGLTLDKVVAVGEIGLDYFYDHSDRDQQRRVFERQLQIAAEFDLPVVIHTREADEDTRAILKNALPAMKQRGVIHSFTSGLALAEYCLSEGFCLGFNGICTFNRADNVREVVGATPLDQTLLETDAPFLTPAPYRGKENAPKYLPFVADKVAEVHGVTVNEVLTTAYANSQRVFFSAESTM